MYNCVSYYNKAATDETDTTAKQFVFCSGTESQCHQTKEILSFDECCYRHFTRVLLDNIRIIVIHAGSNYIWFEVQNVHVCHWLIKYDPAVRNNNQNRNICLSSLSLYE